MYDKDFGGPDFGSGDGLNDSDQQAFNIPQGNYGGARDFGGNGYNGGESTVKKILPIAIILIIVLIAGYFVFSYISSQKEITLELQDTDANPVSGRITSLKDPSLKPVTLNPKEGVETTFSANLFPGEYKISASATGYKNLTNKTLTITSDKTSYPIVLTRDITAIFDIQLPTEIFEGQTIAGKLTIQNTGGEFNARDITPIVSGPIEVKMALGGPDVIATGATALDFNLKTKTGSVITAGQKVTVAFSVSGSEETSEEKELLAFPGVKASEVTISGLDKLGETKAVSLTAGKELQIKVTIKNTNKKAPLKNIKFEIVPDTESEETSDWFRFVEPSNRGVLIKEVDELAANTTLTVTVFVEPPIQAKLQDSFGGNFKITATSMNGEISKVMNLEITKEVKAQLNFVMTPNEPTIACKRSDSTCETKLYRNVTGAVTAYLENTGDIEIVKPINIAIDVSDPTASPLCTTWISTFNPDSGVPDGAGGFNIQKNLTIKGTTTSKTPIEMDITATIDGDQTQISCPIKYTYVNPTTNLVNPGKFTIKIKRTISAS